MPIKTLPAGSYAHSFCPGCGHGIVSRLLNEVIEETNQGRNVTVVAGVGCSCNLNHNNDNGKSMVNGDLFQAAHGRAAATATAMKHVRPDMLVVSYQGDGDGAVIGLAETLNAAYRNENITVIFINNTNFGMTGGQMSWTTLPGEITTTSEKGRDCSVSGAPFHLPELIAREFNVAYSARGSVHDARAVNETKKMLRNAIDAQLNNEGYSIVEVVIPCPTNLHLSPAKAIQFVTDQALVEYPTGEFKKREVQS